MNIQKIALSLAAFAVLTLLALGATMYADASGTPKQETSAVRLAMPTGGPTVAACPDKPGAPQLLSPANGSAFRARAATLVWKRVHCAASYFVTVKQGTFFGSIVDTSSLYPTTYTTKTLPSGHTYVWSVQACNARGCQASAWWSFTLKP